jgi:SPP1 gp7 family putative phage head morphogenesis protein
VPPKTLATELAAIYRPVTRIWQDGLPRIIAAYEQTISALTTDAPADIEREIDTLTAMLERLFLTVTPALRSWALRVERYHRSRWVANTLAAASIDLDTMLSAGDVEETVETVVARNVALVRDVSDQARGRISEAVFRGVQQRTPAREVAKELREVVDMGRARSVRIASDQATKLTSALDTERMQQAGIEKWKWMHSGKLHPREEHRRRHERVYTFAEPPADMPGELPFCGCRKLAVIDLD